MSSNTLLGIYKISISLHSIAVIVERANVLVIICDITSSSDEINVRLPLGVGSLSEVINLFVDRGRPSIRVT